jgi:lipoyl(octanoyl) transferase
MTEQQDILQNIEFHNLGLKDYKETWDFQQQLFDSVVAKRNDETSDAGHLLFVEHPHVFTLGKSGDEHNLLANYIQLQAKHASFYHIDRGGDITYHGPGQLVGYPIFDLSRFGIGLREYIYRLEESIIKTIAEYGLTGSRLEGATGVWLYIGTPKVRKICAIGVKSSHWVTMHGFALNVNTDLSYFNLINPCGFTDKGVTSIQKELGHEIDFAELSNICYTNLADVFGFKKTN